ncbi:MAG: hypothetical protein FJX65_05145 [Alphaproteobacteria bacterium]|nr:hypothetical protein [Alphaproteobacteria bacterium]
MVETSGRFEAPEGITGALTRMAAVSRYRTIQYWSISRQRWRSLVDDASALEGPDRSARRPDFALPELGEGATFHFWLDENSPAGSVVYRARLARSTFGYTIDIENVTPIRAMLLPMVEPGQHRFHYSFEPDGATAWRYYSLMRTGPALIPLPAERRGSYVNRAVAVFRYVAGIPTDTEPPAARTD